MPICPPDEKTTVPERRGQTRPSGLTPHTRPTRCVRHRQRIFCCCLHASKTEYWPCLQSQWTPERRPQQGTALPKTCYSYPCLSDRQTERATGRLQHRAALAGGMKASWRHRRRRRTRGKINKYKIYQNVFFKNKKNIATDKSGLSREPAAVCCHLYLKKYFLMIAARN